MKLLKLNDTTLCLHSKESFHIVFLVALLKMNATSMILILGIFSKEVKSISIYLVYLMEYGYVFAV